VRETAVDVAHAARERAAAAAHSVQARRAAGPAQGAAPLERMRAAGWGLITLPEGLRPEVTFLQSIF
jgi:hypothetical protein